MPDRSRLVHHGSANTMTTQFDSLECVTNVSNPLGAFTYAYVDTTSRLQQVTYPNGQVTNYNYYPNLGDQRLKEIQNLKGSTPLSDFQYTYNPVGTIATWAQQQDSSTPTSYALTYDATDQTTGAVQTNTATSATVSSNLYNYDPAGNRLAEKTLTGTTAGQFNSLNQLIGLTGNATLQTETGKTSLPVAQVSVNGTPAALTGGTGFTANVPLPSGTNTFSIVAQDASGHTETQRFSAQITGATPIQPTYDKNGNTLVDEKGYAYTWDSLNRLISITYPTGAKSLFAYDGLSRRVQIMEKTSSGAVSSTKNYLWAGSEIAEERDTTNTVQKRFFPQGEQQAGVSYYYTRDHLGSVRGMCSSTGTITSRMVYDAYGRVTTVSGTTLPTKQYAGDYYHAPSGLNLTLNRAYDANSGRWSSRDPLEDAERKQGPNLYEYVINQPFDATDPLGTVRIIDEEDTFSPSDWSDQPILVNWVVTHDGAIVSQGSKKITPRSAYGSTNGIGYATLAGARPGDSATFVFICLCKGQWQPNGWAVTAKVIDPWGITPEGLKSRQRAQDSGDIPPGVDLGSGGGVSALLYGILGPAQCKGRLYAQ